MRLTRYTDYALRVLMYLAVTDERCTIADIADRYQISKNHLMKVVQQLNQQGYVSATRGKSGGLKLGRDSAQINLGELIRHTEADFSMVECFDPASDHCRLTQACRLKGIIDEALQAFLSVFDQYTLADLIGNNKQHTQLVRLLNL
ncbi:RrF2 family transcriptional regulator [Gilvimarinus xylanilyticus]|uniref:Rrf2 family transcriptional regulator n=1 Tax=Gilvimarinus xylanilyticus TaxID=2944139 RepID=A0A9X2KSC1_9GAMM|nr:Rrf2 family transcriptional regulator [Gilvimarinus xylanilyticus]